ncbi:uncharacterized protein TNCV_97051 [Trichonephila clavipes]|nr:uncharacterized protein TNCV_97051 [Trichonephila clavipes]
MDYPLLKGIASDTDTESPWIHEVISVPIDVHQLDSIGNEIRQTRQRISSRQQSNVGVDGPRRGVKTLYRAINKGTRVGLRLRKPISMMFR